MNPDSNKATSCLQEFLTVVDAIYGVYLDAIAGFSFGYQRILQRQKDAKLFIEKNHPEIQDIDSYLENGKMSHLDGRLGDDPMIVAHTTTQREYKERNLPGGRNYQFIANMGLTAIYQYWEDYYRAEVARHVGKSKNDIICPIMGDLRLLRHSILHHKSIAIKDVEKCEILTWYKEGDVIFLTREMFAKMVTSVEESIQIITREIQQEYEYRT